MSSTKLDYKSILRHCQLCLYGIVFCWRTTTAQAERSPYFLYSTYLNNGHPKITSNTREKTPQTNISVISTQLVILLLLAGDIELNPGPTPTVSTPDIIQTTVPVQHATRTWPTHLLGWPLGAVGLVGFPRLGPAPVPVGAPRAVDKWDRGAPGFFLARVCWLTSAALPGSERVVSRSMVEP